MSRFDFLTPEFVDACNKCGIQCHLDCFPWEYLGWTDEAFMEVELHFTDGTVIPKDHQKKLLRVVRAQETLLEERWAFVQKRDAAIPKRPKFGKQLEMF